jgi:transcription elongation GreA/GreB family factor
MSDLDLKTKLLGHLRSEHEKTVLKLKAVIDDAQKSANEYGAPKDRYDSYRMQLLRKKDMYSQQLAKLVEQAQVLEMISLDKPMTEVKFGSLVITQRQKLFVSIGIGKIEMDGETYYAISPNVPVYDAMRGLKVGDEFDFRGQPMKILAIS